MSYDSITDATYQLSKRWCGWLAWAW